MKNAKVAGAAVSAPMTMTRRYGPRDWYNGPAASVNAQMLSGRLPEWPIQPTDPNVPCAPIPYRAVVEFKRIPVDTTHSLTPEEARRVADHFQIMLCVGDEIAMAMDASMFADAFLAVVPRWFWIRKDQRP